MAGPEKDERERIAEVLRRRLEELRARDGNLEAQRAAFFDRMAQRRPMDPTEARTLARKWLERCRGMTAEEALQGRLVSPRQDLVEVVSRPGPIYARETDVFPTLKRALWLVPGIRERRAEWLVSCGLPTLLDLTSLPQFAHEATRVARWIQERDIERLHDRITMRGGRGHPLALALSTALGLHDLLFLDLETMGLFSGSPIVVVGLAFVHEGTLFIKQWTALSPEAEEHLLHQVITEIKRFRGLVTFNGRSFDWPYLLQRVAYYGMLLDFEPIHFDLLPHARRAFFGKTSDCRLSTLAREVLGLTRKEDIPGELVPTFYNEYLQAPEERIGLLAAIVSHNRDDLLEMVRLYEHLLANLPWDE